MADPGEHATTSVPAAVRRGNLALPLTRLIGREQVLGEVVDLIRTERLVTITGVGGVGKTRLAIEAASLLADEHPDGTWFVELAAVTDASTVADAIATTLGITGQAGTPLGHSLAEALSGRRTLIVLDNCEHLVAAVSACVVDLLGRATTVRVLATSRESLDVAGEQRRLLLPLTLAGDVESPAYTLFAERAKGRQSRIDFADAETAAAVLEICRSLDGLPLGIELAAARTLSMTPIDIRDRLDDRFRLLTASSSAPRRQQTLRELVAWSFDLLTDAERSVLMHASVFAGGFDVRALAAVAEIDDELTALDLVDALVRKSLLTTEGAAAPSRSQMLETIRQFAEDALASTGRLDATRDRHAAYFAAEAAARWATWNGPGWRAGVDWLVAELANLRVAFGWSRSRGDLDAATDIAAHCGLMGASIQLFEPVGWAFDLREEAAQADVRRLPRLCTAAAWSCFTGHATEAVVAAQRAVALESLPQYEGCEPGLAGLIEALAHVYSGHLDRYVEAAELVAALPGNARGWGLSLLLDGLQASGRVDEALALTEEAMAAARSLGNPYFIAYAYWTSGGAFANVDPAAALERWREGLDYVRAHRVDFFTGFIARDAARLRLVDAGLDDALTMFDAAIESFEQAGNVAQLTITLASATALFERMGKLDQAATLYSAIVRQPGSEHHVPELPDIAERLVAELGETRFAQCGATTTAMTLLDTAAYARAQIHLAHAEIRAADAPRAPRPGGLSAREVEVLQLLTEGLTTRDIAERLFISAKTADRHIQNLYTKIGTSNRAAATRWAVEHGVS